MTSDRGGEVSTVHRLNKTAIRTFRKNPSLPKTVPGHHRPMSEPPVATDIRDRQTVS